MRDFVASSPALHYIFKGALQTKMKGQEMVEMHKEIKNNGKDNCRSI